MVRGKCSVVADLLSLSVGGLFGCEPAWLTLIHERDRFVCPLSLPMGLVGNVYAVARPKDISFHMLPPVVKLLSLRSFFEDRKRDNLAR